MLTPPSNQDPQSSAFPGGSVVLADIPQPPPSAPGNAAPPPFPPEPPAPQDTFVVPAPGQTPESVIAGQGMGGGIAPPIIPSANGPLVAPAAPPPGNPWPKRILVILAFVLLIAGAFVGGKAVISMILQGGSGGSQSATVVYWGLWEDEPIMRPVIDAFQTKNPTIKIQYVKNAHQDYRQRLQTQLAQGTGPDVFRYHNTWVAMLQDDLAVVPKTVMTQPEFAQTFYPVASSDLVAGQTIYGIPVMYDGLGLYYNEELFAKAGISSPPTTWEDLLSMVPRIAKPEGNTFAVSAIALGTTNNIENFSDILATMFMQNGASLVTPTSKEAEEALTFYRKFATSSDPVYTWNEGMDDSIYAFSIGRVAMIFAPSWRAFTIKQLNPNLKFKIAPIPQLPGTTVTWASYWVEGVSSKSKNQKAAWEFVKFLSSKEGASMMYTAAQQSRQLFGEPYMRTDLAPSLASDPYLGAFVTMVKDAKSFPVASRTWDGDTGIDSKMIKYMENAVNGMSQGSSPTQELDTMSKGFQQVLSSYGLVASSQSRSK
jgi:multiple sugar transport system substrate-binding protein